MLELVERDMPLVAVVHGIAGVGKSTLLHAAALDARARGTRVVALDGRAFEPTERGFLTSLGSALGTPLATLADATGALAGDARVLLTIDTHEQLRLLDAWLRQSFVPALPENARLLLAGRDTPSAWQRDLGDLLRTIRLENLSDESARTLLRRAGVDGAVAGRVARVARGHPLSLQLAAGALAERPGLPAEDAVLGPMVEELARLYIDGLDPMTRRALDAAAVVRRTTLTLLEAMLPDDDPAELFGALRALPFVELGAEGLVVHDTVRVATSALLQASDPARHRAHRRAAWTRLRAELRTAGRADLWRYTADLLYLVENPIVRDAFFPSGSDELTIEPACAADHAAITAISAAQQGPEATALVELGGARRRTASGSSATPRGWCRDSRAFASRRTSVARCCAAIPSPPHGWSICAALRCLRASACSSTATRWHPATPLRRRCGWTSSVPIWSSARTCGGCTRPCPTSIAR